MDELTEIPDKRWPGSINRDKRLVFSGLVDSQGRVESRAFEVEKVLAVGGPRKGVGVGVVAVAADKRLSGGEVDGAGHGKRGRCELRLVDVAHAESLSVMALTGNAQGTTYHWNGR